MTAANNLPGYRHPVWKARVDVSSHLPLLREATAHIDQHAGQLNTAEGGMWAPWKVDKVHGSQLYTDAESGSGENQLTHQVAVK